ncbi:MAG: HD domain-containing protein [Betaproteobacteria bacterium]|nr:HD domain-containing protein [Betaproteobacteria bacterium]
MQQILYALSAPVRRIQTLASSHPFYIHIGTLFMMLMLAVQVCMTLLSQHETHALILRSADTSFDHVAGEARLELKALRGPIETAVGLSTHARTLMDATTHAQRMEGVDVLTTTLRELPQVASVYVGYDNGDFFLARSLPDIAELLRLGAPVGSAYLVQSIDQAGASVRWVALDKSLKVLREWEPVVESFDPRKRPWYQMAQQTDTVVRTEPYVFATTGKLGRSVSRRAQGGRAVVGADLLTGTLSNSLRRSRVTVSTELAVFDNGGRVLAFSEPEKVVKSNDVGTGELATLADLSALMAMAWTERNSLASTRIVTSAARDWAVKVIPLATSASQDYLAVATPLDELMAEAVGIERRLILLNVLFMLLVVPLVWWVARSLAAPLGALMAQTAAIRRFDFKSDFPVSTRVEEIHQLAGAVGQMKDTIQRFLDVSIALASERSFDALIERVLREVLDAAGSDGCVIYLHDETTGTLKFISQRWAQDGRTPESCPDLPVADRTSSQGVQYIGYPRPPGLGYLNARYGEQAVTLIAVPLQGRTGALVGTLFNFIAPDKAAPSLECTALMQAFASAAAVAIDQQQLLQAQKNLLNAFIGLVAGAIDAKSTYTGGHCQRVPELTEMLARAAHEVTEGPFADYSLSDEQWEAVRIAAWLHDCGKVTTPEYVVDKATKLETLYDRIHEVRMRVEVLKRDAEIAALRSTAAGGDAVLNEIDLREAWRQLDDDYAFLASCNEGGEFMSDAKLARLNTLAQRTWQRTLDNRLGVSWEERSRMEREPAQQLPVTESLLSDKPEHILEREPKDLMPQDNPWGFQLKVPKHLYNRGELYNLSIGRGTLAEEERYKINDHIVQSIIMLSRLPFPSHLKQVVEIAGGHHEKMDGSGYPKRLQRDQMSVEARIMAIADIFEALTATDRPYKKGKKLSEAIKIMGFMVKDHHIDPDLFKLFLTSGIHLSYARKHLPVELIDEVDISAYLG